MGFDMHGLTAAHWFLINFFTSHRNMFMDVSLNLWISENFQMEKNQFFKLMNFQLKMSRIFVCYWIELLWNCTYVWMYKWILIFPRVTFKVISAHTAQVLRDFFFWCLVSVEERWKMYVVYQCVVWVCACMKILLWRCICVGDTRDRDR